MQCSARSYNGEESYVFFSYCHQDKAAVYPIIEQLVKDGCRVWYDEGITAGASWPEMIAKHLDGCSVCICAVTEAFSKSHNCRNEMTFALENNIHVIALIVEDFTQPLGLRLQMANTQQIRLSECGYDQMFQKIYSGVGVKECIGEKQDITVHSPDDFKQQPEENTESSKASILVKTMNADRQLTEDTSARDRAAEERRKAEEAARAAEERRKAEEAARAAEERRKAEEAARAVEERRKAEEAARAAEERCKAEEAAKAEAERRKAEEAAKAEAERRKAEEAARAAEERRKAEEAARAAEERRKAEEAARVAEERRKAEEAAKAEAERRKAEEAAKATEARRIAEEAAAKGNVSQEEVTDTDRADLPYEPIQSRVYRLSDSCKEDDEEEELTVIDTGEDDETDSGHTVLEKKATAPVLVHFDTGRLYEGKYPMTSVGRSAKKCDIVLSTFATVSSHHLDLIIYKGKSYIIDRGSANGTALNGTELEENERAEIEGYAEVRIAHESFFAAFDEYAQMIREKMTLAALLPEKEGLKKFLFGEELTLGRSHRWDPSLFRSEKISRNHAVIIPCESGYMIEDISANGTYVNKIKLNKNEPILLRSGDIIKMGSESYTYQCWILEK